MNFYRFVGPVLACAVLAGAGFTANFTRDKWLPILFPTKPVAKADDGHGGKLHGPDGEHLETEGGPSHDGHGHSHGSGNDRVKLSPQAQKNLGLDVDTPVPQEYWRTILIPGIVVDRPGESDRGVASRVAGIVTEIRAKPGATVKAGEPLFTLQLVSEFLQATQADLAKASGELKIATDKRAITQNLVDKGVQSGVALIEDDNQIKRFATQVQAFRRQLALFGLTPDQVNTIEKGGVVTEVVVAAPQRTAPEDLLYEVQELKVNLGDQVQAGQSLALLSNHQKLYVEGRAFKSEADALAAAAEKKVPIRAEFADEKPGVWKTQDPLTIHHLSNQVDTATRTFGFFLPLDNQPRTYTQDGKIHFVWRYRPGQRVRLRMPVEKLVTLGKDGKTEILPFVFPNGAVVRDGAEAYMFVQSGDIFIRKPVHVLFEDRNEIVVANDGSISDAEFVVRNQAAALNRALKAAAGGGPVADGCYPPN